MCHSFCASAPDLQSVCTGSAHSFIYRLTFGSVGPFERDTVVVGVGRTMIERLAADGQHDRLLRVQTSTRRRHVDALHVRRLQGPAQPMPEGEVQYLVFGNRSWRRGYEGNKGTYDERRCWSGRFGDDIGGHHGRHDDWISDREVLSW